MKRIFIPILYILIVVGACATKTIPLENTRWYLLEIEGDRDIVVLNDKAPFLELDFESLKAGGNATCNNYFCSYTIERDNLSFGKIATTMMMCQDETNQEHRFLQALSRIDSYEIRDNKLYLLENSTVILVFEKR